MGTTEKSHESGCPIGYSLDIFGDRWTLLILRDLILMGKQRYGELLNAAEGIASNILSDRLKRLETFGIVTREPDPEDGRQVIYRPTGKGHGLAPVLLEIAAWGATHDRNTAAPTGFAESYYANREAYYKDHQGLLAALFAKQAKASH